MSINRGENTSVTNSSEFYVPSTMEAVDESNYSHTVLNANSCENLETSSTTPCESSDPDLIESVDTINRNQNIEISMNSKRNGMIRIDGEEKEMEKLNTIEELGLRIKGYNGSKIHRIMSIDFLPRAEKEDLNQAHEKQPNSKTPSALFDDALGIRKVDVKSNDLISTKPYLQIEPFHSNTIKPFSNVTEHQRNNVIAKEPLKADVYKV